MAKNNEINGEKLTQIYNSIYGTSNTNNTNSANSANILSSNDNSINGSGVANCMAKSLSKAEFEARLAESLKQKNIED